MSIYKITFEDRRVYRVKLFLFYTKISMKINEAMQKFLTFAEHLERKAESTLVQYRTSMSRFCWFLEQKYGEIPELNEVKLDDILEYGIYLDQLVVLKGCSKKKTTKLGHNTKTALITTIKTFFKWCKTCNLPCIDHDIIPLAKQERNEVCYLSREEILAFFECCKQEKKEVIELRNELFFRLAYYTWLRKGEILNLTFDEILSGRQFQIIQKFKRKRTVFIDPSSKIREIALQLKALYLLKPAHQVHYHNDKDYVFICLNDPKRGKKMKRGAAQVLLERYRDKLKIKKKVTIHSFRHSFATTLLEKWVDIREVQVMLWHATISSTQVYTHIAEERLKRNLGHLNLEE